MSSAKDTEYLTNKKILRIRKAVKHPLSVLSAILYTVFFKLYMFSYIELSIIHTLFRPTEKETSMTILFQNLEIPFKLPSTSSDMTKIFKTNVLQIVILFCRPLLNQPETFTFCFCRCLTLYSSDAAH